MTGRRASTCWRLRALALSARIAQFLGFVFFVLVFAYAIVASI